MSRRIKKMFEKHLQGDYYSSFPRREGQLGESPFLKKYRQQVKMRVASQVQSPKS